VNPKRMFLTLLVLCSLFLVVGCNGVIMNAEYSQLLDRTASLSYQTTLKADAGDLTEVQMKDALRVQSEVWLAFKNAKDGKK